MSLRILLFVGALAPFHTLIAQGGVLSPTQARRADSSGSRPRLGDTVTIAGRVTLGTNVVDTSRVSMYVQDASGAGIHIVGDRGRVIPEVYAGDSVLAVGVLATSRAGRELTHAVVTVIAGARRAKAPLGISRLVRRVLDSAGARLVTLTGIVTTANVGTGDHRLKLADRSPDSTTASIYVVETEVSVSPARLERFEPEDVIGVTGVLVAYPGTDGGQSQYYLLPRSADDVHAIVLSRATQRRLTLGAALVGAVLLLLAIAFRVSHVLRATRAVAEEALRESEARYRLLVEEAPVGILVHRRGRVLFANSAFTAILRIPPHRELVGASLVDLVHRDDRGRMRVWLKQLDERHDTAVRARERFTRIDGTPVEIELVATSTIFAGEKAIQVVVHDITAPSLLEGHLRHAQKMEAVGQLAAGVAHDFNNILTAIAGYTQLILDEYKLSEALRKDVEVIQRAGERASGLTKQLLALSRRQLVREQVVDLNDVISSSAQLLRRTIDAGITLDFSLAASPCLVLGDSGQLEQVLMNLVLNARDATAAGGTIRVETQLRTVEEPQSSAIAVPAGDYVALLVRDTGAGMSPETVRRVFEPFFTTKRVGEGTGLGLASVYGIVTGAHGCVWAESVVDVGTEFTVLLPRAECTAGEPRDVAVAAPTPVNGVRILLIEDETSVRAAARRILERDGFTVHEAKNASDASLLWEERGRTFACIVSDVVMPGLRGPELIEKFRRDRDVPVLFVSGYTDRALGRLDLEVPNTAFLQKPFQPKQLSAAVSALLREAAVSVA